MITSVYVQPEEVFVMTTSPIDAVVAIHNAFRRDMAEIDAAASTEIITVLAEMSRFAL